jgi:pectate lyase
MVPRVLVLAGLLLLAIRSQASGVGFGGMATGGLGKPVFIVTTLVDAPSHGWCGRHHCSLRDALAACKVAGGGNVYFTGLSGNINIGTGGGNVTWDCPNSTIDGSTAANHGVQIVEGPAIAVSDQFLLDADNVIVRYMRFRCTHYSGDPAAPGCTGGSRNVLAIVGGSHIWIDHCSFEWGTKMLGDIGDGPRAATDITYSNNIFAESLGPGAVLIGAGATRVSLYRNAFISNAGRQPDVIPHSVQFGVDTVVVELVENYYYNFMTAVQFDADEPKVLIKTSVVGNVWQQGPYGIRSNERIPVLYRDRLNRGRIWIYLSGNRLLDGGFKWSAYGASGRSCDVAATEATPFRACTWPATALRSCDEQEEAPCGAISDEPLEMTMYPVLGTSDIKEAVLATVGASLPCRDALDAKVVADARSNGAAGAVLPLRAATMPLPDLTAACPATMPPRGYVVQ